MAHDSITEAADAIGINRTTLIEQLHRLEGDLGAALFHRATADGQPHRPTRRGAALLQTLATPHIQTLREARARLPRHPSA
jgi:DNA-binding transcriptional LysR family regulator